MQKRETEKTKPAEKEKMRKHKTSLTLYDNEKIQKDNLGKQANDKLFILSSPILQPGEGLFQQFELCSSELSHRVTISLPVKHIICTYKSCEPIRDGHLELEHSSVN